MASFFFVITLPSSKWEKSLKSKERKCSLSTSGEYEGTLGSLSSEASTGNDCKDFGTKDVEAGIENPDFETLQNTEKSDNNTSDPDDDIPMEELVARVLSRLRVSDSCWSYSRPNDSQIQVSFTIRGGVRCERMLRALRSTGIGTKGKSSIAVVPCALHYTPPKKIPSHHRKKRRRNHDSQDIRDSAWSTFVQSVRSRLTVAQVAEQVRAEATLTFDFCILLIIAALMSAIGLAENSTVFVVASMLISPLMGPIMAGTFGTAIRDRNLQMMGVRNEFIGLLITTIVGFIFGLVICLIDESYGVGEWPTSEILSRSDLRSLWVGALTAIPSGAAVAIAILADNTASLVGVAISASLLPPAVNAGLLWAMAVVQFIFLYDDTKYNTIVKTQNYSDNPAIELAVDGFISLCLTLINILCIYLAGILVFKIKEVAPLHTKDEQFWKHDIKMARNFNKNIHDESKSHDEMSKIEAATNTNSFEEALDRVKALDSFRYSIGDTDLLDKFKRGRVNHLTWSPNTDLNHRRTSAHELRGRYRKLAHDHSLSKGRLSVPTNRLTTYNKIRKKPLIDIVQSEINSPTRSITLPRSDSKFIVTPVPKE